jgi:hypothetical protein
MVLATEGDTSGKYREAGMGAKSDAFQSCNLAPTRRV